MTAHQFAYALLGLAILAFAVLLFLIVAAVVGGSRKSYPPPPPPEREPFSEDTERAVAQNMRLFGAHPDRRGWRT